LAAILPSSDDAAAGCVSATLRFDNIHGMTQRIEEKRFLLLATNPGQLTSGGHGQS
jgi:hypothetical protein